MTALPTFTSTTTGPEALETLNAVLGRHFDLTLYGGVGDGVVSSDGKTITGTDNSSAWDAMVAACKAKGGGTLWIPKGTYRIVAARKRIDFGNVTIDGPGHIVFDTDDIRLYGRILFDGYISSGGVLTPGYIYNTAIYNVRVSTRVGPLDDLGGANDPLGGDKWGAQANIVTFRGCRKLTVRGCELFNSVSWTLNLFDCQHGTIDDVYIHDAVADGIHLQAGTTDITINRPRIVRVGDDAIAIGAGPTSAYNERITIQGHILSEVGAKGIAVYGPTRSVVIGSGIIDTTWLSGIAVVPSYLSPSANAPTATTPTSVAANNSDIVIGPQVLRNIGMRDSAAYNRGAGIACGIQIEPSSGSISNVSIAAGQVFDNIRNGYVMRGTGTLVRAVLAPGQVYGTLVSGGAGQAGQGTTGYSYTPDSSWTALPEYVSGAVATPTVLVADTFDRADGVIGSTSTGNKAWTVPAGTTANISGNKMVLAGNYPYISVDGGYSDCRLSFSYTAAAKPVYAVLNATATGTTGVVFSTGGQLYSRVNNSQTGGTGYAGFTALTGSHTVELVRNGNTVSAYIDGSATKIASITVPTGVGATTFGGIGGFDGSFATGDGSFDNFKMTSL